MELKGRKLLICDCEKTMALDGRALARACGEAATGGEPEVQTQLCRAQIDNFRAALGGDTPLLVGCTQESPLFDEVATEAAEAAGVGDGPAIAYVNIRERAGWSKQGAKATPKIAALLAEAALTIPPTPTVSMESNGVCLVYGNDETALEAAMQLASRLDVTLLLKNADDIVPPRIMRVPVFRGRVSAARGHMGAFEITVDGYAPASVSSRGALDFEAPRDGADQQQFGVRRGVAARLDLVVRPPEDLAASAVHEHRADRHLARLGGGSGFAECQGHGRFTGRCHGRKPDRAHRCGQAVAVARRRRGPYICAP